MLGHDGFFENDPREEVETERHRVWLQEEDQAGGAQPPPAAQHHGAAAQPHRR